MSNTDAYLLAQEGIAKLKAAIYTLLSDASSKGMRNVDIGISLGIYGGHKGHEGHIPRTLLAMMEEEKTVEQDENKVWWLSNK